VKSVLLIAALLGSASFARAAAAVDFKRDIQPLFADRCYQCHGSEKQKGGLRLDRKQDALTGGDSGKVILPGKSAESLLIKNVSGLDPDNLMPPKGKADPLTTNEIALLRSWIDAGALWPDDAIADVAQSQHWAFRVPQRPIVPALKSGPAVRNSIDAFVRARLEQENIVPSPEADRPTLIRRLSFDLLGLPPKPDDVEAFVNDSNPRAYEALVDRLLASENFGERWARHWLDLARYADSDGYEKDAVRPYAYLYRDWVINAINRDMPFDEFSIEQLAGDLLPDATLEQKVATGFHRQTLTNREGGVDQEEFRCKATVDRVNTTATVWIGLTVACAECHTHKYDPITQREYYQLYAFFNNASEKDIPAPRRAEIAEYKRAKEKWDKERDALVDRLEAHLRGDFSAAQARWETGFSESDVIWEILEPASVDSLEGTKLEIRPNRVITASGKSPATDTYEVEAETTLTNITGFRLEVIDVANKGPGRAQNGNFVVSEFKVKVINAKGESKSIALTNALADNSQPEHPPGHAIDGNNATGWSVAAPWKYDHVAIFETMQPLSPDGKLSFSVAQQYGREHTISRFRIAATTSAPPFTVSPREVTKVLTIPPRERTDEQKKQLTKFYAEEVDSGTLEIKKAIAAHGRKRPTEPPTKAAVLAETGRKTQIHIRGDFLRKGDEVEPATLSVLHPFKPRDETPDRLDLARWLFEPTNPLTGRVAVNHIWKHLFGRGLVATTDDFGTRGEKPSHPELLDFLATEFPRLNWSRKALIRLILTSATYRQSSAVRPELVSRDPNNILLARQNRLRLEAEVIRDAHLAVSGLLNAEIGGPSVRPPLPSDLTSVGYANQIKWKNSEGPDKYRRGLYTFFQRTVPYPMLMTFDAPDSNVTCTRRERSNTPIQALTLLNDPVFFECAQALGRRIASTSEADTKEKVRQLFAACLSRPPSPAELDRLVHFHEVQSRLVKNSPISARALTGMSETDGENFEAATFVALARTLMNLDEFVTRE
jgi:mono/diheme cytochrome c family protein